MLKTVERWGVYEVSAKGFFDKNPFVDYNIKGIFKGEHETVEADGFYDGDGIYKVRFMPSFEGEYSFELSGNFSEEKITGEFTVISPGEGNHGPVRVANTYHFAYEDGTPYYSVGTTCYAWTHQPLELQEKTLKTLRKGYFNKIRFCVFPKHYDFNLKDPITFPYQGKPCDISKITSENFGDYTGSNPDNIWDFQRFKPEHFRMFEKRIQDLMHMGIEADLIIMHPYDRWGFAEMSEEEDELYWNYVVARFSAFRNVWWSLANEYDLMKKKTIKDWERYASIICKRDPYNHLRSIHNCVHFYDYNRPWITHCSIQRQDVYKCAELVNEYRERYKKPIVLDEIAYEGNIVHGWGNISGEELVRRFWEAAVRGGYAGHGETYMHPENILWWSHGGHLHGTSHERIKFLHKILSETPRLGLKPGSGFNWDENVAIMESAYDKNQYMLFYFGLNRPGLRKFYFDEESKFSVEIIDTWEMTVREAGVFKGKFTIELPSKEYMAVRIRKI